MSDTISYTEVLANLRDQRDKIQAAIEALERLYGIEASGPRMVRPSPRRRSGRPPAYGATEAIRAVFASASGDILSRQIVEAMKPLYGDDCHVTRQRIGAMLSNMERAGEIEHVGHGVWRSKNVDRAAAPVVAVPA